MGSFVGMHVQLFLKVMFWGGVELLMLGACKSSGTPSTVARLLRQNKQFRTIAYLRSPKKSQPFPVTHALPSLLGLRPLFTTIRGSNHCCCKPLPHNQAEPCILSFVTCLRVSREAVATLLQDTAGSRTQQRNPRKNDVLEHGGQKRKNIKVGYGQGGQTLKH